MLHIIAYQDSSNDLYVSLVSGQVIATILICNVANDVPKVHCMEITLSDSWDYSASNFIWDIPLVISLHHGKVCMLIM